MVPMKRSVVLLFLILAFAGAWAEDYLPGDAPVVALRRAYLEAGKVFPITRYPASRQALFTVADRLPPGEAKDAALAALRGLGPSQAEAVRYEAAAVAAYGLNLQSAELPFRHPATGELGFDPFREYLQEPAPLYLELSTEAPGGYSAAMGAVAKREFSANKPRVDNLPVIGQAGNPVAVDNMIYWKGVVAWADGEARFSLGRDKYHLGPGAGSTIMHSGALPYLDALTATLPFGRFRLDWVVSTIIPYRALGVDVDSDPAFFIEINTDHTSGFIDSPSPSIIFYNIHRFEWLGERFRAAIAGQMLLTRSNNMFTIVDFLPVSIWHNADVAPNNMGLALDFSWAALPGLAVNFMAGYDDISANLFGVADDGIPTIDAYILSFDYYHGTEGFQLDGLLEFGYTHYLWGNFDGKETMGFDMGLLARAIGRYQSDGGAILLPLTSPYGPGALWSKLKLDLSPRNTGLAFGLDALVLSTNTLANLVTLPFTADPVVREAPRDLLIEAGFSARAEFGAFSVMARPSLIWLDGQTMIGFELGGDYKFGIKR
jgi:hypothetical protein